MKCTKKCALAVVALLLLIGCSVAISQIIFPVQKKDDDRSSSFSQEKPAKQNTENNVNRDSRRAYLASLGFVESSANCYEIKETTIGAILAKLDLKISDLYPTVNQSIDSDIRSVSKSKIYYLFTSLFKDKEGYVVHGSLNNPSCPCHVTAIFLK